jgi:hypothetical protein
MLTQLPSPEGSSRNLRSERRLWHDGDHRTPAIGCTKCPDRTVCGGLQVASPLFDCLGFCCHNPQDCDSVCRNKPQDFAQRVREVGGFSFDNVPRSVVLRTHRLPPLVPLIYHGHKRVLPFKTAAACLPLYAVIQRQNGETRYESRRELAKGFSLGVDVPVILTGTASDPPLERWWSLGSQRRERIRALRQLGIALVTTPNYSLFVDQPRWDDLHSLKRIAIVHEEFLSEGMPAALHLNARTDRDWDRWTEYVAARPEVTHIAFEFATGAGWELRMDWHLQKLMQLAERVARPVHLVVRGGTKLLGALTRVFSDVTLVESSLFMKTKSRQRARLSAPGRLTWRSSPTNKTNTLDSLLAQNWRVIAEAYAPILSQRPLIYEHAPNAGQTANIQRG